MQEKYEKPELLSQKMEINVLRAICENKKVTSHTDPFPPDFGCSIPQSSCDGCSVTNPDMS
jgi:hypothetical protein